MTYFAAVFARVPEGWTGREVDMDELEHLDEVAEVMRDAAGDEELTVAFVEEDEEWFAIVRLDGIEEPRVFISDARAPVASDLAAVVYEMAEEVAEPDEGGQQARAVAGEPGGDADLLADLGVTAQDLLTLTVGEGLLPADVLSAVAEQLGFASELDKLR